MKILMEMLAIQSEGSRGRGIGRYSEELSKEILNILKKDEIFIYLNSLYPENKEDILNDYLEFLQSENFKEYELLNTSDKSFEEKHKFNYINSVLIKNQLTKDKNFDLIHYSSVFEGLVGKGDTLNDFSNMGNVKNIITLYDFIPLIYKDVYLSNKDVKKWYFSKLKLIYEADMLLAISEATKEDAINILGIPENKVVNISGAIDSSKFYQMSLEEKNIKKDILNKFNINNKYIMYTGGIDFRKNIESSIKAFANISKNNFDKLQYVIVCKISNDERNHFNNLVQELNIPKNKIIMTGFVSDEELNYLYNMCELFIFPSIYEGFGLPVLEAMTCGKIVIGSNVSSIPEIIGRNDCMFNPLDINDISNKIDFILDRNDIKEELENYFFDRAKEFSWNKSANIAIAAYNETSKKEKENIEKIKIAFFSPLPSARSGISDYSLELLPFLSIYMDIDIFVDDYEINDDYLINNYNIYHYSEFETKRKNYTEIIYQFGNSEFHNYMYNIALDNPGIIVLHDFFLSGLVQYIAHKYSNPNFFFDNLVYSHGKIGEENRQDILDGKKTVVDVLRKFPMNKKVIDSAKEIIVHSQFANELFNKYYPNEKFNISVINQLIKTPSRKKLGDKTKYKASYGYKIDKTIIGVYGHISETKQYDFIIDSMFKNNIFNNNILLVFVGDFLSAEYKQIITNLITKYKLEKNIIVTGFVSDDEYRNYLLASDIAINLRIDSRGETSRALLMNMAYALPTIINDYATFSELPDDTVCKVAINAEQDFVNKLTYLINDKEHREKISHNAYIYIRNNHNIEDIAKKYFDIVNNKNNRFDKNNSIKEIAKRIVENNIDDITEKEYYELSRILKNNVYLNSKVM